MPRCVFCLEDKPVLTDEHVIPAALGSDVILPNSSCESCQRQCNRSFEHRFLKGSNFIAMLRAMLGIRGRRNEPIYGFDQHGNPLTVTVQAGFPPIRVGIGNQKIERPMQIILADDKLAPLTYGFLPNEIRRPITKSLFDGIVEDIPPGAIYAAFWADGDFLAVNPWRELLEAFVVWSNSNSLTPMASTSAAGQAPVPFVLDWNTEDRNRGLTKICFMYALSKMELALRFSTSMGCARDYILTGRPYPSDYWRHAPILQWNGPPPGQEVIADRKFSYFLATVTIDDCLFSMIALHTIGLFAVKLSTPESGLCSDSVTTYLLEKQASEKYALVENSLTHNEAVAFSKAVAETGQL